MKRLSLHKRSRQNGLTLLVAMIMLMMITVTTIATYNISRTSIQIVGNMQFTNEAMDAANSLIQEAISTIRLVDTPTNIILNPCGGNTNTRCFDMNNDGVTDITVALTPTPRCIQAQPIPNVALNPTDPDDIPCYAEASQDTGIIGTVTGNSQCANSTWQINAVATDTSTQTSVEIVQGAAVRAKTSDIDSSC